MAETVVNAQETETAAPRIYEVGYHIVPTVAEEDVEKVVSSVRSTIEGAGGSFIAEGAPTLVRLAYNIEKKVGDTRSEHDRGYFGWIKFEAPAGSVAILEESLKRDANMLRYIIFSTVREETRARLKMQTIREVKRTDTIKTTRHRKEEAGAPVSEEDLDKALTEITTEQ